MAFFSILIDPACTSHEIRLIDGLSLELEIHTTFALQ